MSKMLENQQSYKKDYYNSPANEWLREYLEQINKNGYGNKVSSDKEFAKKSHIKYSKIRSIAGGSSPVTAEELIKIAETAKVTSDEILFGKDIPDNLKVGNIEILSRESYNKLYKHTKGGLFPGRDNFLIFLDYLIQQEDFILELSEKSKDMLEKFKTSKNISKITDYNDYDDFKKKIINNKELSKELRDIITDSKVREMIRELVTRYIYDHLK